ncbi:hypothetical protein CC86DRAFT_466719 [Ophiobolus disseminans]|uniref:Uncharacterized protein n=1 Tax=Ophiobolus disseminans TaxID=1469910 RepID=A0A6A7A2K8_9PLEO|nr:hypothetical protein CC86DRAFT_466719 [Ophiobolus disseminans]
MAMAAALLSLQTNASSVIQERQGKQGAQIAIEIIKIFGDIFKFAGFAFPEEVDAWDWGANPNMCDIYMETTDGLNCYASVRCNDGLREYNAGKSTWSACYQGGRQFFNDPRIGDFSIQFSGKDGIDGQGLTSPLLQVKDVGNWKEIPVSDLAAKMAEDDECRDHLGTTCDDGPYVCMWLGGPYEREKGRTRKWRCGVPKTGMNFPGFDSDGPTNSRGYRPGWCGVHVTQYQKPDPSKDQYTLEARVVDANQNEIGSSGGKKGSKLVFNSKLWLPFVINSRAVDADPLDFEYDNVRWNSNDSKDHHCSVGNYDHGKREIDCGFTCK